MCFCVWVCVEGLVGCEGVWGVCVGGYVCVWGVCVCVCVCV